MRGSDESVNTLTNDNRVCAVYPIIETKSCVEGRHHSGRHGIFNLRIRYAKVVRFIPNRTAAPLGPPMIQLDSRIARSTCSRSTSSRVLSLELRP